MKPGDRLRRLFLYDGWANHKMLTLLENEESFKRREKALSLFHHILAAEELWFRRVVGANVDGFEVWPDYTFAQCGDMIHSYPARWTSLVNEHEADPDHIISYKNTSGVAYDTMLSDILHHVIIHGQHHRAQIAALLRESGITPPPTDFIFYTRADNKDE